MHRFRYIAILLAMMVALNAPMDVLAAKKKDKTTKKEKVTTEAPIIADSTEGNPSDAADQEMGITKEDEKTKDAAKEGKKVKKVTATDKEGNTVEVEEEATTEVTTTADIRNKTRKTYTQNDIDIIGESAIVIDIETGEVLYKKNEKQKMYPASITKIMTGLIALENRDLNDAVHFSKQALNSVEKGSSALGIKKGERLTISQSLYVMMLKSANDVAHGIAYEIGGDLDGFADLMNERAKELGCEKTHFVNSSGLPDDEHYTTAKDFALIAKAGYENKTLRKIMSTPKYTLAPTNKHHKKRKIRMGNRMIQKDSDYYYKKCIGGKTGYTIKAGGTLVAYAKIQGRVLCGVVLKSTNSVGTYKDMTSLFKYIDKNQDLSVYGEPTTQKKKVTKKTTADEKIIYEETFEDDDDNKILLIEIIGCVVAVLLALVIIRILWARAEQKKRLKQLEKERIREQRKKRREERLAAVEQREIERRKRRAEQKDKEE
ncbi:MAG: serine hydrolase [Lachnospiraceae bacterium]|nr:serine hydrolase [Lachnospiraceae bacterium]